tara:strand:- start:1960 stop:2748 length:789 start_codon:yes stop_codon:yes gene_type:complete
VDSVVFSKVARVTILTLVLIALIFLKERFPDKKEKEDALYLQDFEDMTVDQHWFSPALLVIEDERNSEGLILRQNYVPSSTGTPFIGKRFKLRESVREATLTFDMKIDPGFEFVKGGKLHGLGGGSATTGCKSIDPDGWSVRLMWRQEGKPVLYIYDQERKKRCGDNVETPSNFTFERGVWYTVSLSVKLNSAVGSSDGAASLFINREKLIEINSLNLTGNMDSAIDCFMYNSFYGGNDPSWSPTKEAYIFFDNFQVKGGSF